jgi:hypothetical protein
LRVQSLYLYLGITLLGSLVYSCKEGTELPNAAPDTHLAIEEINLDGPDRLNSSVRLSWYGTDIDGFISYYEYSINGTDWAKTTKRDSTFRFSIEPGQDTADINFYVRATDNKGLTDPVAAHVVVPLKNAIPEVTILEETFPTDTAFAVLTFRWRYSDPDGNQSVTNAYLKVNNGDWFELNKTATMISLRGVQPKTSGVQDADLFYGTSSTAESTKVTGFNNGGDNIVYLKVVDLAGSESKVDTSNTVFIKKVRHDLLFIGAQPQSVTNQYRAIFDKVYPNYDLVDFDAENGKFQPKFWNPTFTLLTSLYDKIFINTDQSLFTNPINGNSGILLEFAAPVLQNFTNQNGKSFITTSFPAGYDVESIKGVLPLESFSQSRGQALISNDSIIRPLISGFPKLQPEFLLLGADPFVPSVDAESFYEADLTAVGGWTGPSTVASVRRNGSQFKQVFFSVELYKFTADQAELEKLFDTILNQSFNW